MDDGVG